MKQAKKWASLVILGVFSSVMIGYVLSYSTMKPYPPLTYQQWTTAVLKGLQWQNNPKNIDVGKGLVVEQFCGDDYKNNKDNSAHISSTIWCGIAGPNVTISRWIEYCNYDGCVNNTDHKTFYVTLHLPDGEDRAKNITAPMFYYKFWMSST